MLKKLISNPKQKIREILGTALALIAGLITSILVQAIASSLAHAELTFQFEPEVEAQLKEQMKNCGASASCFTAIINRNARSAHDAYVNAVKQMHPVVRFALDNACKAKPDLVMNTQCARDTLYQMYEATQQLREMRREQGNTGAHLEDELVKGNHFIGKIIYQTCGATASNNCFDANIAALRNEVIDAYNFMKDAWDGMAVASVMVYGCGQQAGGCGSAWRATLRVNASSVSYAPRSPLPGRNAVPYTPGPRASQRPQPNPSSQPDPSDEDPSPAPSAGPSGTPSGRPSGTPSGRPSARPSGSPSARPSGSPSARPSGSPSARPSGSPSARPSGTPSARPSSSPSTRPSGVPSSSPSTSPSSSPSGVPSDVPSNLPSNLPSGVPSVMPSVLPSVIPSAVPSALPNPIVMPSSAPSGVPSVRDLMNQIPVTNPSADQSGHLDCSPDAQARANRLMFSRDFEARITGQAIAYACRVKEQSGTNPAAVFLAEAGLRLASICRRSEIEIIGSSMVEEWFAWSEETVGRLKTMQGVAGIPELTQFETFLKTAREGGRDQMFQVVLGRNRPGSLLRANFCPWKNAIETANPGSTIGFPREIVACPTL